MQNCLSDEAELQQEENKDVLRGMLWGHRMAQTLFWKYNKMWTRIGKETKNFHFQEGQSNSQAGGICVEFYLAMVVGEGGCGVSATGSWGRGLRGSHLFVNFAVCEFIKYIPQLLLVFILLLRSQRQRFVFCTFGICVLNHLEVLLKMQNPVCIL